MSPKRIIIVGISLLLFAVIGICEDTILGPSGGRGGDTVLQDTVPPKCHIIGLDIWAGDRIDAIQVIYQKPDGSTDKLPKRGDSGGKLNSVHFGVGEFFGIFGRYGDRVDSLYVLTQRKDICGFKFSARFGGAGGSADYQYASSPNTEIVGLVLHTGDEIDAIGIIVGTR